MPSSSSDQDFPCSLTISIPLPTARLASSALRALEVDQELSPLVRRSFSLKSSSESPSPKKDGDEGNGVGEKVALVTEYKATTNRMLRVAVNGFMESLGVVLGVMEELDVDVLRNQWSKPRNGRE
ncbi:MAG: hypothetical protein M1835_000435 [Candelina submexicana]|nr:MAG: hypothetical protein M1835_000435 [Candelina submexicana]